jgi:hypothetical protein
MEDPTAWIYKDRDKEDRIRHEQERVAHGFSAFDWWNFNSYLDWVIVQGLEMFKNGAGHPVYEEVQTMDDWRRILDKMIEGFKAHDRLMNDYDPSTSKEDRAVWEEGRTLFIKFYDSLWD